MDFQLSPADLPSLSMYKAAGLTQKPRVGNFWFAVKRTKTLDGESRFSTLCRLMHELLSVPCSNADSERSYSVIRKFHTDQRSSRDQSAVIALMTMNFTCDNCCHSMIIDTD